jgi:hypothetical protein
MSIKYLIDNVVRKAIYSVADVMEVLKKHYPEYDEYSNGYRDGVDAAIREAKNFITTYERVTNEGDKNAG